eukprot:3493156-Amphidinium_carterae.1
MKLNCAYADHEGPRGMSAAHRKPMQPHRDPGWLNMQHTCASQPCTLYSLDFRLDDHPLPAIQLLRP